MSTRVGVVVVNYHGGDLTLQCLRSLLATDWPPDDLEVLLVDNSPDDGVADRVESELPAVRVIRSPTNVGFAGGCNLGIHALGDAHAIALVNNDAVVDPGWLTPLVATLAGDPDIGAACPKILLRDRFREVEIETPARPRGRGDRRDLGVRISGVRLDGADVWSRARLAEGFWGSEPADAAGAGQWTSAHARLLVPVPDVDTATLELRVGADSATRCTVRSGASVAELEVVGPPQWYAVAAAGPPLVLVNNVGTELTDACEGADRGYLEADDGRFDDPVDVFAWCGAAVALSRAYLDDVGHFDDRLFLYFEDLELAWRGNRRGWRSRTAPTSIVHHLHAATSVEGSAFKDYYNDRNRLLVAARHADRSRARAVIFRYLLVTGSYFRRDVVAPLLRGTRARGAIVLGRLRAFAGFLRRLPGARASRRRDRTTTARHDPIEGSTDA